MTTPRDSLTGSQEDSTAPAVRAVIFDYGHTFLNFAPAQDKLLECYQAVRAMLEREAHYDLPDAPGLVEAITRRIGEQLNESYERGELAELDIVLLFEDRLASLGVTLPREQVYEIAVMEHRAFVSDLAVPPENLQVLARLRERGLKLGLVSNAHFLPAMMREDIERLGIAAYLDGSVFSSEIGVRKPHPAIFRKVLGELEVEPAEAVFVGDRVRDDIGGAKDLGMRGVLTREFRHEDFDGTDVRPDHVIDRLPDLLPYIEQLLQAQPQR